MYVVNFFGGACVGKSTLALGTCAELKLRGESCEFVPEVAKWMIYRGDMINLHNAAAVMGAQEEYLQALQKSGIQIAVMESTLLSTLFYNREQGSLLDLFARDQFSKYNNINFMVRRTLPYTEEGRHCSEPTARDIDLTMGTFLRKHSIPFTPVRIISPDMFTYIADIVISTKGD